ncbi:hypothetical protein ACFQH6_04595 [Halobacteriaceae archaeon GCM10025711]
MVTRDIYASGFDEESGKTIRAACLECDGRLRVDGGEIACPDCGIVIDRQYERNQVVESLYGSGREFGRSDVSGVSFDREVAVEADQ